MARAGIARARILELLRGATGKQYFCSITTVGAGEPRDQPDNGGFLAEDTTGKRDGDDPSCWVPHPRNGIYVPKGQQRLMDDVPPGAASFGGQTYWVRNVDGVEKPDPDHLPNYFPISVVRGA